MSMMVSFVLSFFPRDVLDEILNLIESVSEDFPSYSYIHYSGIVAITYFVCKTEENNPHSGDHESRIFKRRLNVKQFS